MRVAGGTIAVLAGQVTFGYAFDGHTLRMRHEVAQLVTTYTRR
jgi:hypothetical protein